MYERWLQQNNFIYFDGLRALSIISVIVFHAAPRFSVENSFTRIGHVGVDLFFVISGFLISSLLIREKRATGRINLRYFYARRALRIFPLYFGLLFFHLFIVYTFIRSRHPLEAQEFIANFKYYLTYTSNWFVSTKPDRRTIFAFAWSLATEEQFYLVWPPVLLILAGSARPLLFALSLLLLTSGLHTFSDSTSQLGWPLLHTIGSSIPPAICLGVIVAVVLHTPFGARLFQFISRKRVINLSLVAMAGCFLLFSLDLTTKWPLVVAMALAVACLSTNAEHMLSRVLSHASVKGCGKVSYGMYMYHMLAVNLVMAAAASVGAGNFGWGWVAAIVLLSFLVSHLSYRLFESRFLKIKKRYAVDTGF